MKMKKIKNKLFNKRFKKKKLRRRRSMDKRNIPKNSQYKSDTKFDTETKGKDSKDKTTKTFFIEKVSAFENFPNSEINEDALKNENDVNFQNVFDLNVNEQNYQEDKII